MLLPDYNDQTVLEHTTTKGKDTYLTPPGLVRWTSFTAMIDALVARVQDVEVGRRDDILDPEDTELNYENSTHRFVESVIAHTSKVLVQALPLENVGLHAGQKGDTREGGIPDVQPISQNHPTFKSSCITTLVWMGQLQLFVHWFSTKASCLFNMIQPILQRQRRL
jgi:hypothetical protein